jgi:hypothetical protein
LAASISRFSRSEIGVGVTVALISSSSVRSAAGSTILGFLQSLTDLASMFPEGEYKVRAESFDGEIPVGSATFTHDVPVPPTIDAPQLADDPRDAKKQDPVPLADLAIRWQDVTETVAGGPVDITGYEVIVTKEGAEDPNGFSQPIYDVHAPPTLNSLRVPAEFLEPDTMYELEVLALEVSGNQTITVGFFRTV